MAKRSIIAPAEKTCFVCGRPATEVHHVIYGVANKKLSDRYGLLIPICRQCHTGRHGVHFSASLDTALKRVAQTRFEQEYPDLNFREIFGKNFKDEDTDED